MVRLALIEDNIEYRSALSKILQRNNEIAVIHEMDGCEDMIPYFEVDLPDLVIMDIDLPGISGIEGVWLLRQQWPDLKVLMLTVFEEAEKIFGLAAENTEDKLSRADAEYNKGVALTMQKKTAESIEAYKDALRLNPSDSMARENLQRALKEQQKQQNNKKNDQQKEKKQQQKLNKQQIMQLLNALQEQEKLLQQKLQKSKVPAPGQPEKDW